jgi:hypothetical protein
MAVVEGKSDLINDKFDPASVPADPKRARGDLKVMTGTVANGASDSSGSSYKLAEIPADALLMPQTFFDVENWGFAQVVIGTKSDTDALVDQTKATEDIVAPIAQGDAYHGKSLWEIMGLAANPGGTLSLWIHAEADAAGAGSMPFQIVYVDD